MGATNAAQSLYFRTTDYNIGIAGGTGNYSSAAVLCTHSMRVASLRRVRIAVVGALLSLKLGRIPTEWDRS